MTAALRPYSTPICRKDGAAGVLKRRRTLGSWRATWQCPTCRRGLRTAKLGFPQNLMDLPTFQTRRPERKPGARGRGYQAFLRSRVWKDTSKRILHRDRFLCRLRYAGVCKGRATTAHHVTYERFGGNEFDLDLVAACSACNSEERTRRITRRVMGE